MRRRLRLAGLAVGSALLFGLALPNELAPWGSPVAGLVCMAPFMVAAAASRRPREAALWGAVFGALSTALSSFWLVFFQEFAVWTLGGTVLAYTGFGALLAAVLQGASRAFGGRCRPLLLALVWLVYEYLKSVGFLGYPWGLLAYPVHAILPIVQIADTTGVWGVSFLMALANAVAAEALLRATRLAPERASAVAAAAPRPWAGIGGEAAFLGVLVAGALAYGGLRLATPQPAVSGEGQFAILLVQQNTNPWGTNDEAGMLENQLLTAGALDAAGARGERVDLVVWSESSAPWDPAAYARSYRTFPREMPFLPYLRANGTPHLVGTALEVNRARNEWMNGAALVEATGRVVERYGKQHPVPFAEAIPFWERPAVQAFFTEVVGIQMPWVMGGRSVVFTLERPGAGPVRFGVPICFEDAFSDLCRRFVLGGADLLVNLTNDSWSRTVSSLTQHFVVARFRAVENRRVLARSTNGGVTAVVEPSGRVSQMLPWFEPGTLRAEVPLPTAAFSPYTRFGDWFPLAGAAILVAALAASAWTGGRRRPRSPTP